MGTDTGEDASCDEITYQVANQYPVINGCDFNKIENWGKIVSVSILNGKNTSAESDVDVLAITDNEEQTKNDASTNVVVHNKDCNKLSPHRDEKNDPTFVKNSSKSESESTDSDYNQAESKPYACTFDGCTMTFVRPWRLSAHLNLHLGKRPFKCPVPECGKDYINNSHLRRHMSRSHSTSSYVARLKCPSPGCLMELANSTALKRHIQRRHSSSAALFPCTQCSAVFRKHFQLSDHAHLHHRADAASVEPRYRCGQCQRGFHERTELRKHERGHKRDYKCRHEGCTVETITWSALRRHVKQEHPPRYPCSECGKEFGTKGNLHLHEEIHVGKKHACQHPGCNKEYAQKRNLVHHVVRYHCALRFPCTYAECTANLATKQKLKNHIARTHESSKPETAKEAKQPKKARKDSNLPKRSMVSKLLGISLPVIEEKKLLNRSAPCTETFQVAENTQLNIGKQ